MAGGPFDDLHDKGAENALKIIHNLRGFYVKVGQYISGRPELLPPSYLQRFRTLQDEVPGRPMSYITACIERELGQPIDEIFSKFDPVPLGVASIGQVHKATLKEGEREVCIKVQFDEVQRQFYVDLSCIRIVLGLLDRSFISALDEMKEQCLKEFDYRNESKNLEEVAHNIMKTPWASKVCVPKPIMSTKKVLIMDFLEGTKLELALKSDIQNLTGKQVEGNVVNQMALTILGEQENNASSPPTTPEPSESISESSVISSSSSSSSPSKVAQDEKRPWWGSLSLGTMLKGWRAYRWVESWWKPPMQTRAEIIDILLKVHGYQIFVDGCFQADPHPGNFLLMKDGRIALLDYGQTKRLNLEERRKLAVLIKAISTETGVLEALDEFGLKTVNNDEVCRQMIAFLFFGSLSQVEKVAQIEEGEALCLWKARVFFKELVERDRVSEIPGGLFLPVRTATLLRGMGLLLGMMVSPAKSWAPYAQVALDEAAAEKRMNNW